jgi:nicotinamidase/pyrazinamidase
MPHALCPVINAVSKRFGFVVMTQDWHTPGHASFASSHPGKKPFETTSLAYGEQVLWPDHCVQGTDDASLHPGLSIPHAELIIRKGYNNGVDSYSAFREADGKTPTGLTGFLKTKGITRLFLSGIATDFCVYVIEDACRGIDLMGSLAKAWADMETKGVRRIVAADIV